MFRFGYRYGCCALLFIACSTQEAPDASVEADAGMEVDTGIPGKDSGPGPVDLGTQDLGVADLGVPPQPCEPALGISPSEISVLPFELVTLVGAGGTGNYKFEITQNESGAIINALSGAYLSGEVQGATDTIRMTDDGCIGEITATISIVEELIVRPTNVETPPGSMWTFQVTGGSGLYEFSLLQSNTGGSLGLDGSYTAGDMDGTDLIEVEDLGTGEQIEATVRVSNTATLVPTPAFVFVPEGQTFDINVQGGSGYFQLQQSLPFIQLTDRTLTAQSPGRSQATLEDIFTGQTAQVSLSVIGAQQFTPLNAGWAVLSSNVISTGDLNGDGNPDLLLGNPEVSVDAARSGAVYVYAGTQDGLSVAPAQTISGDSRVDELGRSLTTADFNGDGQLDFAVGIPRADTGGGDVGKVEIHYGIENGFFETEPEKTLFGRFGGDLFGWGLTSCDFNGDGLIDIAVGAYNGEDRSRPQISFNQGLVSVFMNTPNGFGDTADFEMAGDIPDGMGGWIGRTNMHLGLSMVGADFNNDGACDLAVGTHEYDVAAANTNNGLVYVYKGILAAGDPGGINELPSLSWIGVASDSGAALGRHLSAGDLDGDGMAELAISHYNHDIGSGDSHGALRIFRGRALDDAPITALTEVIPSDWEYVGTQSGDQVGWRSEIRDATGDGMNDLIVSNLSDEVAGGPSAAGTIMIFDGQSGALPETMPSRSIGGVAAGDRLGAAFGVMPDVNGDGVPEIAALAAYDDTNGRDLGVPYLIRSGMMDELAPLAMPTTPSGMRFGWSFDIVGDVNGDNFEDMVVGAPNSASSVRGLYVGKAYLYLGTATGFQPTPALELTDFNRHSGSDYVGYSVSDAGDFNGDGISDFAILARFEDQPSSFAAGTFAPEPACTGTRNNTGAVFVFLGVQSGLPSSEPSFIYYGPFAGPGMRVVNGGFNYNGDNFDDLIVGSADWDRPGASNSGGFALVQGRAADPGGLISVICSSDLVLQGAVANDNLGFSVDGIGDLDGDGCDEVAAGAPFEDYGQNNQGGVWVLFGWGGAGCPAQPMMTVLRSFVTNAQGGYSLSGGNQNIDNIGAPDLVVGMPALAAAGNSVGAVTIIYGDYIAGLPKEPAQDTTPPTTASVFFDTTRPASIAVGAVAGERFGHSVSGLFSQGLGVVLVGSPLGNVAGPTATGGARAFIYAANQGLIPTPAAAIGGETQRSLGRIGERIVGGSLNGFPMGLIGGYDGTSVNLDTGSLYFMDLRP